MSTMRIALLACLAGAGLAGTAQAPAAPLSKPIGVSVSSAARHGASPAHRGIGRPGGHRISPGGHWRASPWGHSHGGHSHWGWGLGLAIGVPWALGWYDPWWSPSYYAPYPYGTVHRSYGYACAQDEDCWRDRMAPAEPAAPTTQVAPAAPGEDGAPTQRPLHLNHCDSARAWFPHVRTCPEGWRLVRPDYRSGS